MMSSVAETINIFRGNSALRNSTSVLKSASSTQSKESSIFGDSLCGEPLLSQELVIDFTPDEENDTDYSQKKCCHFWDFVNNTPEIKNLMVFPEKLDRRDSSSDLQTLTSENDINAPTDINAAGKIEKTAVSMLELVEKNGLIDRIFEAKLQQSMCSLGSREYKNMEEITNFSKSKGIVKNSAIQKDKEVKLRHLMKSMQEWDSKHPKSMEPPAHPPHLHHCVLQRLE